MAVHVAHALAAAAQAICEIRKLALRKSNELTNFKGVAYTLLRSLQGTIITRALLTRDYEVPMTSTVPYNATRHQVPEH